MSPTPKSAVIFQISKSIYPLGHTEVKKKTHVRSYSLTDSQFISKIGSINTMTSEVTMLNTAAIVYPAGAMFLLTLGCMLALGFARFRAIKNGQVKISFYRAYDTGSQPRHLHILGRHVQNHFEVPPLFYAGVLFTIHTNAVSGITVSLAWMFVFLRCVHSYIHLRNNNVSLRFYTFGTSLLVLGGLWSAALLTALQ